MDEIKDIEAEIVILTDKRKALIKSKEEPQAALRKTVPAEWKYRVTWKNEFTFRCERKWTDATIVARQAIDDEGRGFSIDSRKWEGMDYAICIGLNLISTGGGLCILEEGEYWKGDGRKLTQYEYTCLVEERVPETLIKKGYN